MSRYILLEWKKLNRSLVIIELITYWIILTILPFFFIKNVVPLFNESYALSIELNLYIQMGMVLLGGSLINHVFIEEFKMKTITIAYSYPISKRKLILAKILFIGIVVYGASFISFILSGLVTYGLDQFIPVINGQPTGSDILMYLSSIIGGSLIITVISFVPLFLFGLWKRAVIPTVICSFIAMQASNFSWIVNVDPKTILIVLCILGVLSIFFSVKYAEKIGEV